MCDASTQFRTGSQGIDADESGLILRIIGSRDNPLFKSLVRLSGSSRARRESGSTVLDGEHLIESYLSSGAGPVEAIVASESGMRRAGIAAAVTSSPARDIAIFEDRLFAQISQVVTPSGILAVIKTPHPPPIPARIGDGIYLENIQDPGNLGSILRTAAAAGIRDVLLSETSVFAWSPKVIRAGMGAHFHLAIHENVSLERLKDISPGEIVATDVSSTRSIHDEDLRGSTIWMFGNEGAGLSIAAKLIANKSLKIPMAERSESLNVAAATAICLFEQMRQRNLE